MRESAAAASAELAVPPVMLPERDTTALSVERVCCCVYMICILYINIYIIIVCLAEEGSLPTGQGTVGVLPSRLARCRGIY